MNNPAATTIVSVSGKVTQVVLAVTLFVLASFAAFCVLRNRQLSLPDPYNNPYTDWSTALLLAFFAAAITDMLLLAIFRRRVAPTVLYLASLTALGSATFVAWFLIGLLRFLFP